MLAAGVTHRPYSPILYVVALAAIVCFILLGRRLRDFWRRGPEYEKIKARLVVFGEPWATSLLAAFPVGIPFGVLGSALCILILFGQDNLFDLGAAAESLAQFLKAPFVALLLLYLGALSFAQPKLVVPPHLRRHRGALPELVAWAAHALRRWNHSRQRLK
jgi:hypothetical protein